MDLNSDLGESYGAWPMGGDARQAVGVITAMLEVDPGLTLLGLAGSPLLQQARDRGLRARLESAGVALESFAAGS